MHSIQAWIFPPTTFYFSNFGPKAPKKESLSDALSNAATAIVGLLKGDTSTTVEPAATMSPGKRVRVSRQYLEQLERLKTLQSMGVLTDEEFQEQKTYALQNIRQLNI